MNSTTNTVTPATQPKAELQTVSQAHQFQPQDFSHERALGFGDSPSALAIFCNRANTNTWYTLDKDSEPVELLKPALTGYLISIEFVPTKYKGKPSHKLRFKMNAHRPCTLEAGYDSTFAKGFLIAISNLTPEQLKQRITIEAIPADDDKVLFCAVWLGNQRIFQRWDERTDWRLIARKAMDNVAELQRQEN
ncbi:hypothetical protein [Acaryochloris marina]|uniref:Uncharacterized protein n=1 Tax=Acaryochloris marina (strain MBIC 11017) TaxID=329726 RepID=A8ZLA2_ACAM1|nr:hypothetical protein [Acaryochloris marina]ABW31929.1 hypothetical protein AM1_B0209 [Acaryochloris marina MBIC11017]BDM82912.1 hypothetical protein AM10699_57730 [Acaryochloris marina MBIC10699]